MEELYAQLLPVVRQTVGYLLRGALEEDREECVNDTMYWLLEHDGEYDPERGSRATWARVAARSRALNRLRSAPPAALPLEEAILLLPQQEDRLNELLEILYRELKPEQRKLFTMKFLYGMPAAEIAEKMGLRRNACEVRINRLRTRLQALLRENGYRREEA